MVIGIAGGTGSGKTTIARRIIEAVGPEWVTLLPQDAYYHDLGHLAPKEREQVNFDHPKAIDMDLLATHLERLAAGQAIERPIYDFTTHTRGSETERVQAGPVILLEGILILTDHRLRSLQDLRIFVEADPDVRFIRRLQRDLKDRGRTLEGIIDQYLTTVRPMHLEFVEPSKRYADIILPEGSCREERIGRVIGEIKSLGGRSGGPAPLSLKSNDAQTD